MMKMKKIAASLFVLALALVVVGTASICTAETYPAPVLQSPESGTIVTIGSITFSWNAASEANSYMLEKSTNQVDWAIFSTNQPSFITATSWTMSEDDLYYLVYTSGDKADTFYWRVRALSGPYNNYSPYSSTWNFSVLKVPSGWIDANYWNGITQSNDQALWESMASDPLGGWTTSVRKSWSSIYTAVTNLSSVQLIWSDRSDDSQPTPVAFADRYKIQISSSSTFGTTIVDTTTENNYYTTPTLSSGTYYWRVRSETNEDLATDWTTTRKFVVVSGTGTTTDNDSDGMPNSWETQYGLNPNYSGDASQDTDGDGYSNLQEYQAGTDPTSASSHPGVAVQPAAVTVTNISAKLGQTISVGENGVTSVVVSLSPKMIQVNFENDQPVDSMTIYTDENMASISVGVEQLSQKPAAVPDPTASLSGIVINHYIEITVNPTAAAQVQVENNSTINFRVAKSWLSSNNISPSGVLLLRYSNGQWNEQTALPLEKEDATYKYYIAIVPGFSTFAVAGEVAASSGQAQPTPTTTVFIAVLAVAIVAGVITTIIKLKRH